MSKEGMLRFYAKNESACNSLIDLSNVIKEKYPKLSEVDINLILFMALRSQNMIKNVVRVIERPGTVKTVF